MSNTQQQARQKLAELIENAQKGMIIPVRLPSQLEEIAALFDAAAEEAEAEAAKKVVSGDAETVMKENAEFVSVAVHELRTPMTSIRGYSDMINSEAMGPLNDMQKSFMTTIRTNTKRMEGLLQDVSDMSKLRGNTLHVTEKMDMFKNIAMTIENETTPIAEELGKTLTFEIPQGLPLLNTDGELFAKAVRKMVENSLLYSGEDGEVLVRASGDGNYLVVEVIDNGIGMSDEELDQLGTVYWRSEREEVRAHKGSGLGLPIALGILQELGCKLHIHSVVGEGTHITIRLKGLT